MGILKKGCTELQSIRGRIFERSSVNALAIPAMGSCGILCDLSVAISPQLHNFNSLILFGFLMVGLLDLSDPIVFHSFSTATEKS
jgi:hypothetical protein